jgi:3-methyladenine DNA glycosylase/8-oxoguanine DNA glycosylase
MEFRLKPRSPFDFRLTATHMYVLPPAKYSNGIFSRVLRLSSDKLVKLSITSKGTADEPELSVLIDSPSGTSKSDEKEIAGKVSFMFTVDDDLGEFYSIIEGDPVLKYAKEDLYGLKMQTAPTFFEGIVISFCLVWTSFQRAVKMIGGLVKEFGPRIGEDYAFPSAKELARASLDDLKRLKLGFRAERVKWLSTQVAQGKLDLEALPSLSTEELRERLMRIKWVGPGTAEGLLLWRFKKYDAFPIDVWSVRILSSFYPEIKGKSPEEIKEFAKQRWGSYRGLAYYYLMCGREKLSKRLNIVLDDKWKQTDVGKE